VAIPHFRFYNKQDILYLTRLRRFETKLGERVEVLTGPDQFEEELRNSPVQYVLFGIPEDIGIKANYGKGGADSAWLPFLSAFLNLQSSDFLSGEEVMLLGHFDFGDLQYLIENHAQINAINLDAHTDFRPVEGRHSGNGFRYAEEDGYLQKYCVIGVQENYLQQNVWLDFVNNPFLDMITFEDIFIHEKRNFIQAVSHATSFTEDGYCGIELDLDVVENVLTSAVTPSGISTLQARQYITMAANHTQPAYLHICEGAAQLSDGRKCDTTGKLISYLVSDFLKMETFAK